MDQGHGLCCSDQQDKRLKHFHKELDEMLYGDSESNDFAKGVLKVRPSTANCKLFLNQLCLQVKDISTVCSVDQFAVPITCISNSTC
jgi:hypothetical protein